VSASAGPILNIADVPLRAVGDGKNFIGQCGRIGAAVGAKKLGCQLHVVQAGQKAFPRHAHHANEEMFFVVSGSGTYRFGKESRAIRAGDIISAPAGNVETAHQILNTSDAELRYLAFSTRLDPDVVEYADSNKFLVSSLVPEGGGLVSAGFKYIGRMDSAVDYWDGEK
jgi:uncharacterized cupin superfamily protein